MQSGVRILFFLFVRIPDFFEAVLTDDMFNQAGGIRHVAGTQWGSKKYMNMKHLEAALDDAFIAG